MNHHRSLDATVCDCATNYTGPSCEYHVSQLPKKLDCTMDCQNDGNCQLGFKNGTDIIPDKSNDPNFFQYCDCPTNFTGTFCQDSNNTSFTDSPSTQPSPTVTGIFMPNIPSFASSTPSSRSNTDDTSSIPSPIPSDSGSSSANSCTLECEHDGVCEIGNRDATNLELVLDPYFNPNVPLKGSSDETKTQYCDCPSEYSGIICEHINKNIDCEDVTCKHSSTCKSIPNNDYTNGASLLPVCSCEFNGTHHFAGTDCAHPSTSFCTSSPGMNGFQFCTNNGKCRETLKG
jgi:hypothetical protein